MTRRRRRPGAEPDPRADLLDELERVVRQRDRLSERVTNLTASRDRLFARGRELGVSFAEMARIAGVSDPAVINACKRLAAHTAEAAEAPAGE